jgi:DUF971 family protein
MHLTEVKQTTRLEVLLRWSDGRESVLPLEKLRDGCPCAGCKGETVLFRTYIPPSVPSNTPGRYVLKAAELVGSYAIKFTWGDGHDLGIYTWEHLRSLSENEESKHNKNRTR